MTVALLCVAALAYFLPEVMPHLVGGSRGAWEYVTYGGEAAVLWGLALVMLRDWYARAVAAWGLFEALQRPLCRLAFPMDRPPQVEKGQSLCDVALGLPMSAVSVVAALFLAALVQEVQRAAKR